MIGPAALVFIVLAIVIFIKGGLGNLWLLAASVCMGITLANTPAGQAVLGWLNDAAAAGGAFVESIV